MDHACNKLEEEIKFLWVIRMACVIAGLAVYAPKPWSGVLLIVIYVLVRWRISVLEKRLPSSGSVDTSGSDAAPTTPTPAGK